MMEVVGNSNPYKHENKFPQLATKNVYRIPDTHLVIQVEDRINLGGTQYIRYKVLF
jgi:hypothetical protein